ncbi:methyltransferase domain-containing protein [Microcoleus sp. MON1_C5]|uniref:methyltransferase domain-containing protein n=1 Tax=Microcoleus sp. MON1_C5 TaxID=2818828 RepID=UPI002FD54F7A
MNKLFTQFFSNHHDSQWSIYALGLTTIYSKLLRQIRRPPFPTSENEEVNLHLGCGLVNHPKFINIDARPAPHIHYIRAIDNLAPFQDNSVNLVYASHCLEHFSHLKIPTVLAEWFRVLKKDGTLRLSVPDLDLLLDIYTENGNDINTILLALMGEQDYNFNFHRTVFNLSSLELLLKNTGFRQIQKWQPRSGELSTFDDWSNRKLLIKGKSYPVSLNIQAVK